MRADAAQTSTMRRLRAICLSVLVGMIGAATACGPDAPDFYGIYALDSSGYHDVRTYTHGEEVTPLDATTSFVVYDRITTSPSFNSSDALSLLISRVIRYEVEEQLDEPGGEVQSLRLHKLSKLEPGNRIALKARPVRGQEEMVELLPSRALEPGHYYVHTQIGQSSSYWDIVVDLAIEDIFSPVNPACLDRYTKTVDNNARFSWSAFRRQAEAGLSTEGYSKSGRVIMSEEYKPCSAWDESPDLGSNQRALSDSSWESLYRLKNVLLTVVAYGPQRGIGLGEAGLSRGSWTKVDATKISSVCKRLVGNQSDMCAIEGHDAWGNEFQYYLDDSATAGDLQSMFNDEKPPLLVRSSGSDGIYEGDSYPSDRSVDENDFASDLVWH